MDRAADLEGALRFVIGRIEEQATQSGEPLTEEQRFLLNNLPSSSLPIIRASDPEFAPLVPRDIKYERLCALAKSARLNDIQFGPASLDWEFASAVFRLNNHPMCSLLMWAGVKQHRPWWDRFLLIGAAVLFIVLAMGLMFFVGVDPKNPFQWVELGFGYIAIVLLAYFGSRRVEKSQLEKEIDRCRLASRFVGTAVV